MVQTGLWYKENKMPSNIRGTDNFDSGEVIGQNQAWVDLVASRVCDVTYVNDTGRPIMVSIGTITGGEASLVYVDNVKIAQINPSADASSTTAFIVPDGSSYLATVQQFEIWAELR